jgi:ATP-dependent DNA helicase RecG
VLGVRDRNRELVGIEDPLAVEEQIMNIAADGIRPQILPEVEILSHRKLSLVVITVFPGPRRPYYIQSLGREEGSFVRVGSTNRRASSELLSELERASRNVAFDEEPMAELTAEDLDLDLARTRFADRKKIDKRDLMAVNVLARHGRRHVPTVGGILLFGRNRLKHFPDARIRLARFAGSDRASITDRVEADSDPVQAIEEAMAFLRRSTTQGMAIEGGQRRDLPQFPPVALREAVINAVAHADYSQLGSPVRVAVFDDRVEIESPGLLPFGLTIEEMQRGVSKLRNRVIGRVFHELGLIEQWGSGVRRMTQACLDMGLPAPTFEEFGTCFRVTLQATAERTRSIDGTAGRIFDLLTKGAELSTAEIASKLGVTPRTTRTHLRRLIEAGLIFEIGRSKTDPTKTYRATRP